MVERADAGATHLVPRPRVSIGVPVYNAEAMLARALGCLSAQTWHDLEIVVSDNGSDDRTSEILRRHAAVEPRMRIHRLETTIGVYANFDRVLRLAGGEYFMWAAYDDMWEPEHVERLVAVLDADPRVVLASAVPLAKTRDGVLIEGFDRLVALERDEAVEGAMAYLGTPEREGKSHVVYGLYRRAVLLGVDPGSLWNGDRWRTDYHLVFAVLCRGLLRIERTVSFTKTERDRRERQPIRREAFLLARSMVRSHGWVAAYRPVAVEQGVLSRVELARVRRLQRRRHLQLIREQVGSTFSRLRGPRR